MVSVKIRECSELTRSLINRERISLVLLQFGHPVRTSTLLTGLSQGGAPIRGGGIHWFAQ